MANDRNRVRELDGLRGLAIGLVILFHYFKNSVVGQGFWYSWGLAPLRLSWSGVDLFFVLSGYLIGGILLDAKTAPGYYRAFYLRRFVRVFPLYYGWLGLFLFGLMTAPPFWRGLFNTSLPVWGYAFFVQNIFMAVRDTMGPQWMFITWSLAVEEQFYLLLPVLVRHLDRRRMFQVVVASIVCAPIIRIAVWYAGSTNGVTVLLPCRADALGLGVLVALLIRSPTPWIERYRQRFYVSLSILWCGTVYFAWHRSGIVMGSIEFSWLAAFYTNLLILVVVKPTRVERLVFGNPLLVRLGTISYGLYIFHEGIRCLFHAAILQTTAEVHDWRSLGVTLLAGVVTGALAEFSWRFFERPMTRRANARYQYWSSLSEKKQALGLKEKPS